MTFLLCSLIWQVYAAGCSGKNIAFAVQQMPRLSKLKGTPGLTMRAWQSAMEYTGIRRHVQCVECARSSPVVANASRPRSSW